MPHPSHFSHTSLNEAIETLFNHQPYLKMPVSNISLYTPLVAFLFAFIPHIYAVKTYESLSSRRSNSSSNSNSESLPASSDDLTTKQFTFNRSQPRNLVDLITSNPNLTPTEKGRLSRSVAASQNGFESLGFFSAAILTANLGLLAVILGTKVGLVSRRDLDVAGEIWWLNALSLGYLLTRVAFIVQYVRGVGGYHRGVYYFSGVGIIVALFVGGGRGVSKVLEGFLE